MTLLENGIISLGVENGSDEPDDWGTPQSGIKWSEPIKCMIRPIRDDKRGQYTDGKFKVSIYDVHISNAKAPNNLKQAKRAKLQDFEGNDLGEFSVQSVTPSMLVGRVGLSLGSV